MKNTQFYYTKSGKSFRNRYEALLDPEPAFLYFNDKEFSNYDWTQVPTSSLQELYRARAQQIRSYYDYIVLCYSGGVDSTNILESFYYADIPIDEIVMVGAFSMDKFRGSKENNNQDIFWNVVPTLNKLRPKAKITFLDYTKGYTKLSDLSLIRDYGDEYFKGCGSYYSVHNLFWADLPKFLPTRIDKKAAVIFGNCKPRFNLDEAMKPYFNFDDMALADYGNFTGYENYERVNFYTDISTPDLMAKQLHRIWNFYRAIVGGKLYSHERFFGEDHWMLVNNIIYDLKNPLAIPTVKSKNSLLSVRDGYMRRIEHSADIYKIYTAMISKFNLALPNELKKITENQSPCFYSRRYYLTQS